MLGIFGPLIDIEFIKGALLPRAVGMSDILLGISLYVVGSFGPPDVLSISDRLGVTMHPAQPDL